MEKKTGILNTFIRYGKLLFVFLKMSLMAQLEYRINFAAGVLVETGWLLIKLLYVAVVYRAGIKIGVLTPDHILLFIGVYILLTGVYMLYYPNFTSLTTMIRDGKLDMYLVKTGCGAVSGDNGSDWICRCLCRMRLRESS